MKINLNSSISFTLSKKELSPEQIKGFLSWINIIREMYFFDDTLGEYSIQETPSYFCGTISVLCGLKDQFEALNIEEDQYCLKEM